MDINMNQPPASEKPTSMTAAKQVANSLRVLLFLLTLSLVAGLSSCDEDKCESQYCLNGGTCVEGDCHCPTGYTGEHCETKIANPGYVCSSGSCTYVPDGANYATLSACQAACSPPPGGYNCVSGNCTQVSGSGQYSTLGACQAACGSQQLGQVVFWETSATGGQCSATNVTIGGSTQQITQFSTTTPSCGAAGCATFTLNPGTYNYSANCSGTTKTGSVTIYANQCSTVQLVWTTTSQSGYNCVSGNCNYVTSNAQYPSLAACQSACSGPQTATINYVNNSHTTMTITVNGVTKTAAAGQKAGFTGNPGASATGTATTSGKSSSGIVIGETVNWNISNTFPSSGSTDVNLNVSSSLFFLRMRNTGTKTLTPVYVNYGLNSQSVDNVVIPPDGVTYPLGYYKAFTNGNVRAYWQGQPSQYSYWNQGPTSGQGIYTLPFTNNQSVTLVNTSFWEETLYVK